MDKLKLIENEFRRIKEKFPKEFEIVEKILENKNMNLEMQLLTIEVEIDNKEFCFQFLKTYYQNMFYICSDSKYFDFTNEKYTNLNQFFN